MNRPLVVVTDDGRLTPIWPFVWERLRDRLDDACELRRVDPVDPSVDWERVEAVLLFSAEPPGEVWQRAGSLRLVGGVFDACGFPSLGALRHRGVTVVDATRAWAPSVAEFGLALSIVALRRIAHLHHEMAVGGKAWDYHPFTQFTDDARFVNGDLGTKVVGVVGLGAIGGRIAQWAGALGAQVLGFDPYVPQARFDELGVTPADLDGLLAGVDVLFVTVPPTPSAERMIDARRVGALRRGALVVTVTRTAAIDMDALRARVLDATLLWATDVYEVEPVPSDDPIVGRDNVVHLPHVAGRTRDSNLRVADLLADDVLRVLAGEEPLCALTPRMVELRTGAPA